MTLNNLVGISLEKISADIKAIKRLITAAERNIADYSGDIVPESTVKDCIFQAEELLKTFNQWLATGYAE
jgi:hypothetical protein